MIVRISHQEFCRTRALYFVVVAKNPRFILRKKSDVFYFYRDNKILINTMLVEMYKSKR